MNSVAGKTEEPTDELAEAERLKEAGNQCFKKGDFEEAANLYIQALSAAPPTSQNRAVYYGNIAACYMHQSRFEAAKDACTSALMVKPTYTKVLLRRSAAYEQLNNYEKALEDCRQVLLCDSEHSEAKKIAARLEAKLEEQNTASRDEMIGKLKDLGNTVLGKFGVSLDDFKAEKDPNTGSYNIRFDKSNK